jgi:hypothetical protein
MKEFITTGSASPFAFEVCNRLLYCISNLDSKTQVCHGKLES